jgi:hypothetical protein
MTACCSLRVLAPAATVASGAAPDALDGLPVTTSACAPHPRAAASDFHLGKRPTAAPWKTVTWRLAW